MTLDEEIKNAEEVANTYERLSKTIRPAMQLVDYGKCAERHRQLAEWLKELKQLREQTRWIPVSERLPEDGTWNLFTDGKQISVERFKLDAVNHFFPEGRWFSFDEAVAWMPLPQPYKGESEV